MPQRNKIVIIGAGNVGSSCALFAAQRELGDITLIDIVAGMPEGKALDIMEGAPIGHFDAHISGTGTMEALAGADVVIVTAGFARKPGMSRADLARSNTGIVKGAAEKIRSHAPDAFVIVVTNPLDVMTWVTREVTGFARNRVVGMAGALDAARFSAFIAEALGVSVRDVHAMVLGGHGDTMVPLVRCASVAGIPVTELLARRKDRGARLPHAVGRGRNRQAAGHRQRLRLPGAVCRHDGRELSFRPGPRDRRLGLPRGGVRLFGDLPGRAGEDLGGGYRADHRDYAFR